MDTTFGIVVLSQLPCQILGISGYYVPGPEKEEAWYVDNLNLVPGYLFIPQLTNSMSSCRIPTLLPS
jgi:hypothetical protein